MELSDYYDQRNPATLSKQELLEYFVHLSQERDLTWGTCNSKVHGLRFFCRVTLGRTDVALFLPRAKEPAKLPVIWNQQDIRRLFDATPTLQTFGRDTKWLGGELGITMVLHTWNQVLEHHIHVHCVVTGGALSPEHDRWIATKRRDFLFPVKALSKVFRSKYLGALGRAYRLMVRMLV